ncbi:NAD kinase [Natronohydrobacter thiooxidans]|uniref:NAD kinase n=1 Tax=Natronohydrobacter thiooxidans TaxID=87172 RepID=UPI0008FF63BD|nr:NAD kinase [Natronohydrobacter thiooxidans]
MPPKLALLASAAPDAQEALALLARRYETVPVEEADIIIALGGDGFMLQTLHATQHLDTPVYGMNRGTVGFLMNGWQAEGLRERLDAAEMAVLNPLRMQATRSDGSVFEALAINEVSLLRQGAQAAKLRIIVDGKQRLDELVCDGAMVSTPAGSTAYNYSAHGPILPIGSDVLALTPVAAFRPRRWRGAILPKDSRVRFEVVDPERRPVMADADSRSVRNVVRVEIQSVRDIAHKLLFDPGHGLDERLIREQFV